jgi:hypothetical protein
MTGGMKTKVGIFLKSLKLLSYYTNNSYLLMSVIYLSEPVAPLKALAIHTAGNTSAYLSHTYGEHIQCLILCNSKIKA